MRWKFSAMVAMRSVSFTRNSEASRTIKPFFAGGAEHGQHGDFVDQRGGARFFEHAALNAGFADRDIADQFASGRSDIQDSDLRAHLGQKIEQRGTGGIQSHAVNGEAGLGNDQRGHQKKRGRRKIAGHAQLAALQASAGRLRVMESPLDIDVGAEFAQRQFGVIARAHRLMHGGAPFGEQPGKQHAALHLRAGHRQRVLDGMELAAVNGRVAETDSRVRRCALPFAPAAS